MLCQVVTFETSVLNSFDLKITGKITTFAKSKTKS